MAFFKKHYSILMVVVVGLFVIVGNVLVANQLTFEWGQVLAVRDPMIIHQQSRSINERQNFKNKRGGLNLPTTTKYITQVPVSSPVVNPVPVSVPVSNPPIIPKQPTGEPVVSQYLIHKNITATVFWVGEPKGGGSSEDNALSAWDDEWQEHYGGVDDHINRNGYYPDGFTPKENPFYLDLPYNDFTSTGIRKANAIVIVPWANIKTWGARESMMKNRWVKLSRNGVVCYGQIEDAGPYQYDDFNYVFGTSEPINKLARNAGLDVSPALRDCLKFEGLNNDLNKVDWQFIESVDVPTGPWTQIITTRQIHWP